MYSLRGTGCRLLTVGDGDLSFSLALAKQLKCHHLVATTHLSRQDLDAAYGASKTEDTIKQLTLLGVNVVHEVDATKLHLNSDVFSTNSSYDRIIWNFPCVAGRSSRQSDAQLEEIDINKELLEQFFSSVSSPGLLSRDGEVHVSHKAKPPFSHWNIKKCAVDGGRDSLSFIGNVVFDRSCFDGYETKKVATGSGSFPTWLLSLSLSLACIYLIRIYLTFLTILRDALTYIWGKKSNVSKDPSPSMSPTVYPVLPDELLDIDLHPTTLKLARDLKASQKKKRKQGKQSNDMSIVTSDITLQVAGSHIVAIDDVFLDLVCRSLQLK